MIDVGNGRRLSCSWPLRQQAGWFDLGHVLNSAVIDALEPTRLGDLGMHHAGIWEYDLINHKLIWSGGVYDMFGFERGVCVSRQDALACYSEDSRAKLERLRAYAVRHRTGFTIDVEIKPAAIGEARRMRVIGMPVADEGSVIGLRGLKLAL